MSMQMPSYNYFLIGVALMAHCLTLTRADKMGDYTIGNLEVLTQEDGMPSADTGLYLLSQEIPYNGILTSVKACGYVVDREATDTDNKTKVFFQVTAYRLEGDNYIQIHDPYYIGFSIKGNETFGCGNMSFQVTDPKKKFEPWLLSKGDMIGVIIEPGDECSASQCPLHVNMIDPGTNCSQAFYYNRTTKTTTVTLEAQDGIPDDIFINLNVTIEPTTELTNEGNILPRCAVQHNPSTTIISDDLLALLVIPAVLATILVAAVMLCTIFYCYRRSRAKGHNVLANSTVATETSSMTDTYSHLNHCAYHHHNDSSNKPTSNTTNDRRMTSTPNEYSLIMSVGSTQRVDHVVGSLHTSDRHYYEVDTVYNDYELEDEFWEPASQEALLRDQILSLKIKEISVKDLEIKSEIGSGQFATVHHGLWREREDTITEVAVKTLKGEANNEDKTVQFLREAAIMGQFEHPNILQIFGFAYNEEQKPLLIVDLMLTGDLLHHLQSLRSKDSQQESNQLIQTLLSYSRQVAFGMLYLGCKKFVHRDLAARNVLVSNDGTCKIADFGLSRNLQDEDYYVSHGGKIPVKWTAPEALQYRKYSTASDVWSYGCLLYEIWSLGYKPFYKLDNQEVLKQISSGHRLPPPPGCPKAIYNIMMKCWNPESSQRPSFMKMVVALQRPDFQTLYWSPEDIKSYSKEARSLGASLEKGECLHKSLQFSYLV